MIMQMCKDYNLTPSEVEELYEYELMIYSLMKEKQAFEMWWAMKNDN